MAVEEYVQELIKQYDVVVFSKSYCPYCKQAIALLTELGHPPFILQMDQTPNGDEIQDYLERFSGQRTVPNIFIKQKHIGGCDSLMQLHESGQLEEIL
ncbi:glutaredoxin [Radiomyces spectabilis]|uniref:glutaredoxin n=1 Tax=Radiomyces spectabilis TaxID=64574 RepID=UPI00221E5F3B|nr:glutaredoxin [Radiomyces spectabilis]KAI8381281.1 glutaredoxin [Radiomyces spectabilis]